MGKRKQIRHEEYGIRLRELLKEYNMTQEQLSKKTNVSRVHINQVINGRAMLTEVIADELVKGFPEEDPVLLKDWIMGKRKTRGELKSIGQFLTLEDAVKVATSYFVSEFFIHIDEEDIEILRTEFEQKCYIPFPDYENGYFDGLDKARDKIENMMKDIVYGNGVC